METSPPSVHCLLTTVDIQVAWPTGPGLVLVVEADVKRRSLIVLDLSLDVFCP